MPKRQTICLSTLYRPIKTGLALKIACMSVLQLELRGAGLGCRTVYRSSVEPGERISDGMSGNPTGRLNRRITSGWPD